MRTTSPIVVGRRAELALLEAALTDSRRGLGRAVFLVGEGGIGKTRLAGECVGQAAASALPVLRGRASSTGTTTPLRPLVEALSSRVRSSGPPLDPELEPYRPALSRLIPEWRPSANPGFPESTVELAEALLRLLAVLGRRGGVLLVLEDLHDADCETTAVLEYLVDNLADLPILLVGTLRPEPGPGLDLVSGVARRRAAQVAEVLPLAADAVRSMAASMLDGEADQLPQTLVDRLVDGGEGNPYLVEELLGDLVRSGALHRDEEDGVDGGPWRLVGDLGAKVPAAIVQSHRGRIAALGPQTEELLVRAALLGPRFTVETVRLLTGYDDHSLFAHLQAATEANLITPDGTAPDWYAFRHALTAEAIVGTLPPAQKAAIAGRAAAELERADPSLPGERCQLVAGLRLTAADPGGAARGYAEAGRRALATGAFGSAVVLLERAYELAAEADRTDVLESLLHALAEAEQLDQAFTLADALIPAGAGALSTDRRIALHTRLAWGAVMTDRAVDAKAQLATAKQLLGSEAGPERTAALDVVEAYLMLLPDDGSGLTKGRPGRDRTGDAERLARRAARVAESIPLPEVACQAWQLLALLARTSSFDAADACLERILTIAQEHNLPVWRLEALRRLGGNEFMRTGGIRRLEQARQASLQLGAIRQAQATEGVLALSAVLRGDPGRAREIIDRYLDATARLQNPGAHLYLVLTSAALAAHSGRRREMARHLSTFRQLGGEESLLMALLLGLCRSVCALLEEDRELAHTELAAALAWEERNPSMYYLTGQYGLHPLLEAVAGRTDRAHHEAVAAAPAATLAWNQQFLLLADAVLLGREGRGDDAARLVEVAQQGAAPFPMARHLGLRLVSEAALADGWGTPVAWLRSAEEYFHAQDIPAVAGACRALLRRSGASVAQRRDGRDQLPAELRMLGVTLREYEVFALLVDRPANQQIARRLAISPRTAEKHMASLLRKTGRPDRGALCELAMQLCGGDDIGDRAARWTAS